MTLVGTGLVSNDQRDTFRPKADKPFEQQARDRPKFRAIAAAAPAHAEQPDGGSAQKKHRTEVRLVLALRSPSRVLVALLILLLSSSAAAPIGSSRKEPCGSPMDAAAEGEDELPSPARFPDTQPTQPFDLDSDMPTCSDMPGAARAPRLLCFGEVQRGEQVRRINSKIKSGLNPEFQQQQQLRATAQSAQTSRLASWRRPQRWYVAGDLGLHFSALARPTRTVMRLAPLLWGSHAAIKLRS